MCGRSSGWGWSTWGNRMKRSFWDRAAWFYDLAEALNGRAYRAMTERVGRLTPRGSLALDCAAGTGELAIAMAGRAERVLCTDLSPPMLERAARKAEKRGVLNLEFAVRDLTALPDPDHTYDAAAAGNVLHLLEDPALAVSQLLRVTKPGGPVILPTFLLGEWNGAGAALAAYRLLGFRPASRFTAGTYRALLERADARLTCFEVIPGWIPVGLGILQRIP